MALEISKAVHSFFQTESEDRNLQRTLEKLFQKKISWQSFKENFNTPLIFSRLVEPKQGRSILHLAVLDDQLEMVQVLKKDPLLRTKRDIFGLSPIDLAQFLNKKKAIELLNPLQELQTLPNSVAPRQLEHTPYPIFETKEVLDEVLSLISKAKEEDKIPSEKIWMGIYFDKEIASATNPPLSIRKIDDEVGFGVFADQKIPPCTYVGEYTGIVMQRSMKDLKDKLHCLRFPTWEGKKNYCIDAEKQGNFTRFLNHSAKPNLGVQSVYWRGLARMIFISLKEIKQGSQLTFDYGPIYWKTTQMIPRVFEDDL